MKTIIITHEEIKTQRDAILWHLKTYKKITSWEAIKEYGATRLSDIIFKLKSEGYPIETNLIEIKTRFGIKTNIARYQYYKPIPKEKQLIMWG
tara:strand:- start:1888 stop:2166 length:279 start_codon:yes stop_codon:yes gene_type:complete